MSGVLLINANTGLLIGQLTERKLPTSESHQQIVEPTVKGFNLILATPNEKSNHNFLEKSFTLVEQMIIITGFIKAIAIPNTLKKTP